MQRDDDDPQHVVQEMGRNREPKAEEVAKESELDSEKCCHDALVQIEMDPAKERSRDQDRSGRADPGSEVALDRATKDQLFDERRSQGGREECEQKGVGEVEKRILELQDERGEFDSVYSLSGNPADHDRYQIAVLREDAGKGGSKLMHRIFAEGRVVFIGRPINHFPLIEDARRTYLMGGGIGVTPMIAMAHRLHALGRDFALHYCCSRRDGARFLDDLAGFAWADRVQYHFSDENSRADLDGILGDYAPGDHVYTCGPDRFMDGVMAAAEAGGFPEEARAYLTRYLRLAPGHPNASLQAARLDLAGGNPRKAAELLEPLLARDLRMAKVLYSVYWGDSI